MRNGRFLACLLVVPLFALSAQGQPVHPGKTGAELEGLVRAGHAPTTVLSYNAARKAMFSRVDNQGGQVRLLYTGDTFETDDIPDPTLVNTEHVWPQSRFGNSVGGKKSDLHHLFPTRSKVNSDRANKPFAEIPDAQTKKWWAGSTFVTGIPGSEIEKFSESDGQSFEPREADKGNVARAIFYFRAIYGNQGIELNFFTQQRATLLAWHKADPADAAEITRSDRVFAVQGNRNPFVSDPTLAARMFDPTATTGGATGGGATGGGSTGATGSGTTTAAATLQDGDNIHVMTWNLRFFYDADKTDNQSNLAKDQSADTDAEFTARVKKIAKVIKNAGLPQIVALQEIENEKVVQRLADELNTVHGAKYKVGFVQGTDTFTEQDVAYLYEDRSLTVSFARIPAADFTNSSIHTVPSKHCVMTVSHTLPTGQVQQLKLVNCHLKAGGDASDVAQRKKQARVLSGFVKNTLTADSKAGVIVLGDMNAKPRFDATTATDEIGVLRGMETADPLDDLTDLNGNLPANKRNSHVSNRELDRILLSGALLDDVGLVFQQIVVRRDLVNDDESDHFPMVATFTYRTTVGP